MPSTIIKGRIGIRFILFLVVFFIVVGILGYLYLWVPQIEGGTLKPWIPEALCKQLLGYEPVHLYWSGTPGGVIYRGCRKKMCPSICNECGMEEKCLSSEECMWLKGNCYRVDEECKEKDTTTECTIDHLDSPGRCCKNGCFVVDSNDECEFYYGE